VVVAEIVEEVVDVVEEIVEEVVDVVVVEEVEELEVVVVVVVPVLALKVAITPVQKLPIGRLVPVSACPVEETIFWKYSFATLGGLFADPSINVNPLVGELIGLTAAIVPTQSSTACPVTGVVPVSTLEDTPLFIAV